MITKEEFEKAVECCTGFTASCENCPLSEKDFKCGVYLAEYLKENEPAPAATGTSSTKKENTFQIDDSTLLDICQEGIEEMAKIALDDYPNEFLTGYIEAFEEKKSEGVLRGEQSD